MVDQAPSGKKPLPDMMTSIRLDSSDKVEIVDQLLLPYVAVKGLDDFWRSGGPFCLRFTRHEVKWIPVETPDEAYDAIKSMKVSPLSQLTRNGLDPPF